MRSSFISPPIEPRQWSVVFQGFLDVSGTGATLQVGGWDVALVGQHASGSVWVEHFDGDGNDDCDDVALRPPARSRSSVRTTAD